MEHHDSYGWPTFDQIKDAAGYGLKIVTGQADDLSLACKIKTMHTLASGALGMAFPHDAAMAQGTAPAGGSLKDSLEKVLAMGDGVSIDWAFWLSMASQVLEMLKRLLPVG